MKQVAILRRDGWCAAMSDARFVGAIEEARRKSPVRTSERSRTDQRFVAEAVTETGVTIRGESEWEPSHWDQHQLRLAAIGECRSKHKQADLLNVKVGPIRVHRETRWTETVVTAYTASRFDSEVSR